MANLKEIETAYNYAKNGAKDIALLYCVSNYPSKDTDFNLNNVKNFKNKFKCTIGLDHNLNDLIAFTAVSAGAEIVKTYRTLKSKKG